MSIYSTVIEIKRGRYTVWGQSVMGNISHIVLEKDSKSRRSCSRIIFNKTHVDQMLNILEHDDIAAGVIQRTYVCSDYFNSYLFHVLINPNTVVLYDDDDIITISRHTFKNILYILRNRIEKYERKKLEAFL